ncbi:MAG: DUF4157 domain-containing protein [Gemmatimonadaceae bacterium]
MLQYRFAVGEANDPLEREAERAGDTVGAGSQARAAAHPPIRLRAAPPIASREHAPPCVANVLASSGSPLPVPVRKEMEEAFGQDFSRVRVHTDRGAAHSARALNANAYTSGYHVVFGAEQYAPTTARGRHLLGHELAHVVQQSQAAGASQPAARAIQRQPATTLAQGGGLHGVAERGRLADAPTSGSENAASATPTTEARFMTVDAAGRGRVQRIVMSCRDMRLRVETATARHLYRMETCSVPLGSYETRVTVTGSDFELDFGNAVGGDERFEFSYTVEAGQENPADFLRDQASVHVDVVEHVPPASVARRETPAEPRCVLRLDDRELVPSDSLTRNLFEPLSFERTLWAQPIPLGQFGWVEVEATASGSLTGRLLANYGPGRLTDICLTFLRDREASAAPIDHPLLGGGSRTDVTTYRLGGRARFRLPARATIRIAGVGRLRIAGDYLSVIELAAAEGALDAAAEATLSGSIDAAVEIAAAATHAQATLEHPLLPIDVILSSSTIDSVDLAAEIGLRARAALAFRVGASASFDLAGFNLWSQQWDLAHFSSGVSWSGGLKYSPNPGLYWDLGTLGIDTADAEDADEFHEDATAVDVDSVVDALFDEAQAQVETPEGLDEDDALPFDWFKPLDLYPETLDLPNADDPQSVDRDDGPVTVRYTRGSRTVYEDIGVADWPSVGRTFQFVPYDARRTPEQARFNRLLDTLGYDRSGTDAEHVWDVYLLGLDYDRFDNLWPASNQDQQLAGTRHRNQIRAYEMRLGTVAGRWFRLVRVRHPA